MKKIIWVILLIGLMTISVFAEDVFDNEVTLVVDGTELNTYDSVQNINTPPFIYENRTMLPLRKTFELFGISGDQIQWDGQEKVITVVTNEGNIIWMQIDNTQLRLNDQIIETDVPVKIFENRTYVPVAHISKLLGEIPQWDGETRTVTMSPSQFKIESLKLSYHLPRKDGYGLPMYDEDFMGYYIRRFSNEMNAYDAVISLLSKEGSFSELIQKTAQDLYIRSDEFQVLNNDLLAVFYEKSNNNYTVILNIGNQNLLMQISGMSIEDIESFLTSMEVSE